MGISIHSSSRLTKVRYNSVSWNFVYETFTEKARFPKTEPALEGEMDMFAFQTIAGMQTDKDTLASGGQDW